MAGKVCCAALRSPEGTISTRAGAGGQNGLMQPTSLPDLFDAFLRFGEKAEDVREVYDRTPHAKGKRADFLLDKRQVIVEVKVFEDDRMAALRPHVRDFVRTLPGGPKGPSMSLDDLIAQHPEGQALDAIVRRVVVKRIRVDLRDAHEQIAGTRATLKLGAAAGVAFIINRNNVMLRHDLLVTEIADIFLGRGPRPIDVSEVGAVAVLPMNEVLEDGTRFGRVIFKIIAQEGAYGDRCGSVLRTIVQRFAGFCGTKVDIMQRLTSIESMKRIPIRLIAAPRTLDINLGELPPGRPAGSTAD